MALLLGKYDSNVSLAAGNVRQQVDHLVDELLERVVVCAQLDPPSKHMSCFMFNVDTHEFEPYPEGWWAQVIEVGDTLDTLWTVRVSCVHCAQKKCKLLNCLCA
jgi:hypothetical protein